MFLWHICCFYYETLALTPSVLVASCGMVLGRGRFLVASVGGGESPHVVSTTTYLGGSWLPSGDGGPGSPLGRLRNDFLQGRGPGATLPGWQAEPLSQPLLAGVG